MTEVTRLTRLIHSESDAYPVYLSDMATYAPNTMFGATVDTDCLIEFGLEVVHTTEIPTGDVVTEGRPELISGEWYQTWVVRSFDEGENSSKLAEKKEVLKAQAEQLRLTAFAKGFPYRFADDSVYHVQVRASDRGNISDLRTIAKEVIAAQAEMTFPFRVWENISVGLTAPQMVALADKTFVQVLAGYNVSWAYKDAIEAATTMEALPAAPGEYFAL
jgi:hypothetical protein